MKALMSVMCAAVALTALSTIGVAQAPDKNRIPPLAQHRLRRALRLQGPPLPRLPDKQLDHQHHARFRVPQQQPCSVLSHNGRQPYNALRSSAPWCATE